MRQTSFADFHCSLARSLEVMGDWWTPLVLRDLWAGIDRFDDLAADLGISRNLLTQRLEALVADGIVTREAYQERPTRHRYVLSESGRELVPILAALTSWGDRGVAPAEGPPLRFRHGRHACTPTVCCSTCGEQLDDDNLGVRPGPGGRVAPGTMLLGALLGAPSGTGD
ncbi:MAG: helix-turn-helix domain-containing protein [Acidimicrobiales bacterium]